MPRTNPKSTCRNVGRAPAAAEAAAVAVALAGAPMYFYKRGKGRYRKATPEALKAALASVDRKKREGEQLAQWRDELCADRLPDALRAKLPMLLLVGLYSKKRAGT